MDIKIVCKKQILFPTGSFYSLVMFEFYSYWLEWLTDKKSELCCAQGRQEVPIKPHTELKWKLATNVKLKAPPLIYNAPLSLTVCCAFIPSLDFQISISPRASRVCALTECQAIKQSWLIELEVGPLLHTSLWATEQMNSLLSLLHISLTHKLSGEARQEGPIKL